MTAAVILAAGSSSRLGEPKQALLFNGKPFIQHMVDEVLQSDCRPVIAVLGANSELVASYIPHKDVQIVHNNDWQDGIGTSIKTAINVLLNNYDVDSVLLLLCDQPYVNAALLQHILQTRHHTGKAIVACTYGNTIGVPALFDRSMFNHLLLLGEDEGAKTLIQTHPDKVAIVPFEKGVTDIDTRDDYNKLLSAD